MGEESTGAPADAPRVDFAGINALSSRPAGYAVAQKCLEVQAEAEATDPSLRTEDRVLLHPDAQSWYLGALGEMAVGRLLAALGPGWFVRHSVPIGAGTKDVDHLVIGQAGVFAINTKHHANAYVWVGDHVLRVNNENTRYLRAATSDASDVARRLGGKTGFDVPVLAVLAILNARTINDKRAPQTQSVAVVSAPQLVAWLRSQPPRLTATQFELLALAAEEPQTWHVDPRAADTLRVMQRFERLVRAVGAASAVPTRVVATSTPARTPRRSTPHSTPQPPAPPRPARTGSKRSPTSRLGDIARLWGAAIFVLVAILIFRGMANQPCTTPSGCFLPPIYLGLKPLLIFGAVAALGMAVVGTLVGLVRATLRR
ncbi:nuclease-related domain-containing protein [Leifsonia xyli]|uniref:nuclease-related domain-containing protein n=1 Tax=Leifsonia xyli TaxID=1575 RepID=UPI003D67E101